MSERPPPKPSPPPVVPPPNAVPVRPLPNRPPPVVPLVPDKNELPCCAAKKIV